MKLLIINGTPKTDGITYSFVTAAETTARELSINAQVISLSSMKLQSCKMCGDGWGICYKEHICAFGNTDGFNELQEKVRNADSFIFITPVYWGEITEDFKIFIDRLRRCQGTKQWDSRDDEVSFLTGKTSILVAVAGGGGGGIVTAFADLVRALHHMGGDPWPWGQSGVFDFIAVNPWNQDYKREAFKLAIAEMFKYSTESKDKVQARKDIRRNNP